MGPQARVNSTGKRGVGWMQQMEMMNCNEMSTTSNFTLAAEMDSRNSTWEETDPQLVRGFTGGETLE